METNLLTINPYYFMMFIYFFCNTFSFYNLIVNQGFTQFGYFYPISLSSAFTSYAFHLSFWLLIFIFYKKYFKKTEWKLRLGSGWGLFLLLLTLLFFIFNYTTGAGVAGSGFSFESSNPLNYFFVLMQPDLLYFLIAPFLISNRFFWIISAVYFFSLMTRGWMGATFLIFVVSLIRFYPVRVGIKNLIIYSLFSLMILFLLPLLDALKWGVRSGLSFSEIISNIVNDGYWKNFFKVLEVVISRFQNLNYSAYINEHSTFFLRSLLDGQFSWFIQNGIFNSIYCKLSDCSKDFNIFSAEVIFGETGLSWNIDPGLTGWASIFSYFYFLFFIFVILLLFFSYNLYLKCYGKNGILLISVFSLLYFFHGWLNAFFNTIIYAFFLYFIFKARWGR